MATKPMSFAGLGDLASLTAELDSPGTDKEFESISVDLIDSKEQPRTVFEKIEELAESLKSIGQQQPIVVNDAGNGRYVIEQGERRYRAAKLAGLTHLYCVINRDDGDENQRVIRQLTENIQRDDMKLFELSQSVATLIARGMSVRELAKQLGKKESYVSTLNAVAELPKELEKLVKDRVIQDALSVRKLQKLYDTDPKEVKKQIRKWMKQQEKSGSDAPVVSRSVVNAFEKKLAAVQEASDESANFNEKAQEFHPDETAKFTEKVADKTAKKPYRTVNVGDLIVDVKYRDHRGILIQTALPSQGKLCVQLDGETEVLVVDANDVQVLGVSLKK